MHLKIPFLKIDWTMVAWTSWRLKQHYKEICRCSKADSFTFLITAETRMHMTYRQLFLWKFYIKSNYKIAHTLFLAFREQKSLKFDLLGVKSRCDFSNLDVTRFKIFSQTMSSKYIMAWYQMKLRDMKLLDFGLFTKTVGKGTLTRIKYG